MPNLDGVQLSLLEVRLQRLLQGQFQLVRGREPRNTRGSCLSLGDPTNLGTLEGCQNISYIRGVNNYILRAQEEPIGGVEMVVLFLHY